MKKSLVKVLALVCALLMVVTIFAGCTSNKAVTEQPTTKIDGKNVETKTDAKADDKVAKFANKELEVAVFEGGYGKAYWEEIIKKFEADYPGVKVTLTANPKISEILRPRFVAGNPPDFIYENPGEGKTKLLKTVVKEGGLLPLDDVFNSKSLDSEKVLKDDILDGFLDNAKPLDDGKIYFAPAYFWVGGLFYNKTYFDAKGLKAPKTWDEFYTLGEAAKKDGKALFTYQGIYPSYNEGVIWGSIASVGGMQLLKDCQEYKEGAWKSEGALKVLKVFETIAQNDYLLKGTVAMNHTQAQTEFLKGKALFLPCGNWLEGEMKDALPKDGSFSFGFTSIPVFKEGDQSYAQSDAEAFVIPAKAKNPELAKEFLKYNYTIAAVKLNAEKAKGVMPVKGAVEAAKEFIPASSYECLKVFENGAKPFSYQWKTTPKTSVVIADELYNSISSVMNKKMTAEQWADKMEAATAKLRDAIAKEGK